MRSPSVELDHGGCCGSTGRVRCSADPLGTLSCRGSSTTSLIPIDVPRVAPGGVSLLHHPSNQLFPAGHGDVSWALVLTGVGEEIDTLSRDHPSRSICGSVHPTSALAFPAQSRRYLLGCCCRGALFVNPTQHLVADPFSATGCENSISISKGDKVISRVASPVC